MLHPITTAELDQIYALCDRVNDQMQFGSMGHPYSHNAMRRGWDLAIKDKNHIALCHKTGDVVDGIFLGRIQDNSYFMESYPVCYEIAFHADPQLNAVRRGRVTSEIRKTAEQTMRQRGVKSFFMSTHPQQLGGMDKNLKRNGYRHIADYCVKEF